MLYFSDQAFTHYASSQKSTCLVAQSIWVGFENLDLFFVAIEQQGTEIDSQAPQFRGMVCTCLDLLYSLLTVLGYQNAAICVFLIVSLIVIISPSGLPCGHSRGYNSQYLNIHSKRNMNSTPLWVSRDGRDLLGWMFIFHRGEYAGFGCAKIVSDRDGFGPCNCTYDCRDWKDHFSKTNINPRVRMMRRRVVGVVPLHRMKTIRCQTDPFCKVNHVNKWMVSSMRTSNWAEDQQ